jgi:uncharacterized membrane protein
MLPFHELNGELTARASPTVLDLITAAFCAIAGVYATLRPGSDTATAAAGTSISISLVPPLCASGYGVGAAMGSISSGAALLFITNLAAIAVIGTLAFVAAGFGRVDVAALEQAELASDRRLTLANVVTGRMPSLFRSRGGKALRLLLPLAFMAAIYVPLRRALDEVEWQVTARAAVRAALADDELSIVQSRSRVERREVELALVIVGSTADGERARDRITASIQRRAGVTPHLEVYAVPDARAFAGLASTLLNTPPPPPPPAPPPPPPTPAAQLRAAQTVVRASLDELWPSALVGAPLRTEISAEPEAGLTVHVVWLGVALSPDAADSVRRALSARLEREVALRETVIPGAPLDRSAGDAALLAALPDALEASQALPDIAVCVERPPPITRPARGAALDRAFTASMDALLAQHPRVASAPGPAWRVRFVRGACATPTPTPTP